jgi:hypothetical protein
VADCAGHPALRQHGEAILLGGTDLISVSSGALADAGLYDKLAAAAHSGGAQLRVVSGAIGALDALSAGSVGTLTQVTYRGRKPPKGWRGSPAESKLDLDSLTEATVHFSGTARDAALEYLANAAISMVHLSRLAEELVLWSTTEFGFVELADAYSTGSSLMPQKKNPDVPEIVRGKTGRAIGNLVTLLTVLKGLPLTYNRDLQEDKEPLFDSVTTLRDCLEVMSGTLATLEVRVDRMATAAADPMLLATDLAEILVQANVPFRDAHEVVGKIVAHCTGRQIDLRSLSHADMQSFHEAFSAGADELLNLERSLESRSLAGGTSRSRVEMALAEVEAEMAAVRSALEAVEEADRDGTESGTTS